MRIRALFASLFTPQPRTAQDNYARGNDHYEAGRYERAIRRFDLALQLDIETPECIYTLIGKVQAFLKLNQPGKALECFETLITDYPRNLTAYTRKGESLNQLGRFQEAISSFDHA